MQIKRGGRVCSQIRKWSGKTECFCWRSNFGSGYLEITEIPFLLNPNESHPLMPRPNLYFPHLNIHVSTSTEGKQPHLPRLHLFFFSFNFPPSVTWLLRLAPQLLTIQKSAQEETPTHGLGSEKTMELCKKNSFAWKACVAFYKKVEGGSLTGKTKG